MTAHASKPILFITANSIGDAILSTGLLAHLTETYPDSPITIACGPAPASLFRAIPNLARQIVIRKRPWKRHWLSLWKKTSDTQWHLIVDLRNSLLSRCLHTRKQVHHGSVSGQHKVYDYAAVLKLSPPPAPRIWLDAQAIAAARIYLDKAAGLPILALGTSANWFPKQWPITHFTQLVQRLTATDGTTPGACIFIAAAEHERAQVAPLIAALSPDNVIDAIGADLLTVAACLKECQLFVGNDSGLMHLAAAMGVPTIGLFGPGYEQIYGPWCEHCAVVRTPESDAELRARLVTANSPNLMETLTVDAVIAAVSSMVARIKKAA